MKRNKKNKPEFDERQKAVRAKADKAAVVCFIILLFACCIFDVVTYEWEIEESFSISSEWLLIRSVICLFVPINIKTITQILGDADSYATNYKSSVTLGWLICLLVLFGLNIALAVSNSYNSLTFKVITTALYADLSFIYILRFVKGEINERKTREDYIETKNNFDE